MTTKPGKEERRSPRWRSWLGYGTVLLLLMAVAGISSGLWAYQFGRRALEGVNPEPNSIRLPPPKSRPTVPQKPPATPSPQSFFLDERALVGALREQFAQELRAYHRPPALFYDPTRDPTVAVYRQHRERLAARIAAVRAELRVRSVDLSRPLAELPPVPRVIGAADATEGGQP